MNKLTVVDLYCGAGGLSLGLDRVGMRIVAGVDNDPDCIATFSGKFGEQCGFVSDVGRFVTDWSNRPAEEKAVDILVGGPPCQGFSSVNPNRSQNDPRNTEVETFLDAVSKLSPRFVLMENVPGLMSLAGGYALQSICDSLLHAGYQVTAFVLQAAHYGAPQNRWRLFIAGSKLGNFVFPEPTHRAAIKPNMRIKGIASMTFNISQNLSLWHDYEEPNTVGDAISDLPEIANGGGSPEMNYNCNPQSKLQESLRLRSDALFNHTSQKAGERYMERIKALPSEGMNWQDLPAHLMPNNIRAIHEKYPGSKMTPRWMRLHQDAFFSTILTRPEPYWGAFIHPTQDRLISVREAARAQTFPDFLRFCGDLKSQYKQVGNSVPPAISEALGKQIVRHFKQEYESESQDHP